MPTSWAAAGLLATFSAIFEVGVRDEAEVKALARAASTVWVPALSARTSARSTPERPTTAAVTL